MKRSLLLTLALFLLLGCTACGAAAPIVPQKATDEAYHVAGGLVAPSEAALRDEEGSRNTSKAPEADMGYLETEESAPNMPSYGGEGTDGGGVYDRTDAKLIRRATLTIETLEFEAAAATLDAMVQSYDGYYERSDVWGGAYEGATRSGYYLVRIPRQAYDSFLGAVGDVGQLTRRTETSEDVGEAYYDAELRLETLKIKHERLLELLEKATDMESIVALQGYLSDVEYQVDYYAGTLRRYDALIDYASIEISLEERVRLSGDTGEKARFSTQFGAALSNGLDSFGTAVKQTLLWAAYNFMGLLLFAAVIVFLFLLFRRKLGRRSRPHVPPASKMPFSPPPEKEEEWRDEDDDD